MTNDETLTRPPPGTIPDKPVDIFKITLQEVQARAAAGERLPVPGIDMHIVGLGSYLSRSEGDSVMGESYSYTTIDYNVVRSIYPIWYSIVHPPISYNERGERIEDHVVRGDFYVNFVAEVRKSAAEGDPEKPFRELSRTTALKDLPLRIESIQSLINGDIQYLMRDAGRRNYVYCLEYGPRRHILSLEDRIKYNKYPIPRLILELLEQEVSEFNSIRQHLINAQGDPSEFDNQFAALKPEIEAFRKTLLEEVADIKEKSKIFHELDKAVAGFAADKIPYRATQSPMFSIYEQYSKTQENIANRTRAVQMLNFEGLDLTNEGTKIDHRAATQAFKDYYEVCDKKLIEATSGFYDLDSLRNYCLATRESARLMEIFIEQLKVAGTSPFDGTRLTFQPPNAFTRGRNPSSFYFDFVTPSRVVDKYVDPYTADPNVLNLIDGAEDGITPQTIATLMLDANSLVFTPNVSNIAIPFAQITYAPGRDILSDVRSNLKDLTSQPVFVPVEKKDLVLSAREKAIQYLKALQAPPPQPEKKVAPLPVKTDKIPAPDQKENLEAHNKSIKDEEPVREKKPPEDIAIRLKTLLDTPLEDLEKTVNWNSSLERRIAEVRKFVEPTIEAVALSKIVPEDNKNQLEILQEAEDELAKRYTTDDITEIIRTIQRMRTELNKRWQAICAPGNLAQKLRGDNIEIKNPQEKKLVVLAAYYQVNMGKNPIDALEEIIYSVSNSLAIVAAVEFALREGYITEEYVDPFKRHLTDILTSSPGKYNHTSMDDIYTLVDMAFTKL
jgi:hypothetical protein